MEQIIETIKKIAQQNPDGFTISLETMDHMKKGWVVALKETQNSFGDEGLKKVIQFASETTHIMGGWKEGKLFYWDAVMILDSKEEAIQAGKENDQISIYNLETATLIYL